MNTGAPRKPAFHMRNYILIGMTLLASWILSEGISRLLDSSFLTNSEHLETFPVFFPICIVFTFGFFAYELSRSTVLPSFVLAIFFGFLFQDVLSLITENSSSLSILTTIGAVFILFQGGLETPFPRFRALIGPIFSIAFLGVLATAFLFSFSLFWITSRYGAHIPLPGIILLGAALAATDPASIIPSFKSLRFLQPRAKDIAISESAVNDVIGALLTSIFLTFFLKGYVPDSFLGTYEFLLTFRNLQDVLLILVAGAGAGFIGSLLLSFWAKRKKNPEQRSAGEADAALFLAIPIMVFALATALGGNGFLAVFITGLLFQIQSHFEYVEHFFTHTIEGFMKPLIFMLMGTLVNLDDLLNVAGLGILMAGVFMFVIRPFTVFLTLGPFMWGKHRISIRELLFLSFVRETGIIPAVLLVSISAAEIPGSDTALAIGMWVILLTLLIQPPLTPFLAKKLKVAEEIPPFPERVYDEPVAVLCSRGYSFLERMETVMNWCLEYNVSNMLLLHSPEDKYSERFMEKIEKKALTKLERIKRRLPENKKGKVHFSFLGVPGTLESNIEALLLQNKKVSIVFVGNKMLDYRLEHMKRLNIPFMFLE